MRRSAVRYLICCCEMLRWLQNEKTSDTVVNTYAIPGYVRIFNLPSIFSATLLITIQTPIVSFQLLHISLSVQQHTNWSSSDDRIIKQQQILFGYSHWLVRQTISHLSESSARHYNTMLARALSEANNEQGIDHMANVVLFPWLTMLTGCFIYYLISRSRVKMPYTAVMFIVGAVMGYCAKENIGHNAVTESTKMWIGIDGEVLLLAFLPALLFVDSYESNAYLFKKAFSQVSRSYLRISCSYILEMIIVLHVKLLCSET